MAKDRFAILLVIVQLEIGGKVIGRLPIQCQATDEIGYPLILVAGSNLGFELDLFIEVLILRCDPDAQSVADRSGYISAKRIPVFLEFI